MPEVDTVDEVNATETADTAKNALKASTPMVITAIIVVGMFLLLLLYVGPSRFYNAQEVESLVEGAISNGQSYSVVIHNGLTGSYSFSLN